MSKPPTFEELRAEDPEHFGPFWPGNKLTFESHRRRLNPAHYPQLKFLCWNRVDGVEIDREEAFSLYERQWRHVCFDKMGPEEKQLLRSLAAEFNGGIFTPFLDPFGKVRADPIDLS